MYMVLFQITGLVSHSQTMETATTSSATAAEKTVFIQLLDEAMADLNVKVVTTDGHLGIAKYMREKMQNITHNQVREF